MQEWLGFVRALNDGLIRENLHDLYVLGRALLVKTEARFDAYDRVFLQIFGSAKGSAKVTQEVLDWLNDPKLPRELTPDEVAKIAAMRKELDELRRLFEERLREQKERHDGGNRWIGTGGTSPFGSGGFFPDGIRVGDNGGGMSAMQVAAERRFKNYRHDLVLDIRSLQIALKRLRRLKRTGTEDELDVDDTVDQTGRNAGELELVFRKPRTNETKLVLLMDAGGSMTPHARLVSTLFSAAHGLNHFKDFRHYYFHNCVYEELYRDMAMRTAEPTADVLRQLDESYVLLVVGDAYMNPAELTQPYGSIDYWHNNDTPGIVWLRRLSTHFHKHVWLNPIQPNFWNAPSIRLVQSVFPMFPLTVDGLEEAVTVIQQATGKLQ